MKSRHIILTLAAPFIFASCDGGSSLEDNPIAVTDSSTAESLAPDEISTGDTIFYTPFTGSDKAILGNLELNQGGITISNTSTYEYKKVSSRLFELQRFASTDQDIALSDALDLTLSGDTAGAPLGSRLRELLHRDAPVYTQEELQEIIQILNPSGANLAILEDGTLASIGAENHVHLVTSTRGDQRQGSMGGTYYAEAPSTEITFRHPNNDELFKYRFLTANDWIPVLSRVTRNSEIFERGTWFMELVNSVF